jgi:hypothetical protein
VPLLYWTRCFVVVAKPKPTSERLMKGGEMPKKPTKKELSNAGKALRNPRTPEKKESQAAKTLRKGRKS